MQTTGIVQNFGKVFKIHQGEGKDLWQYYEKGIIDNLQLKLEIRAESGEHVLISIIIEDIMIMRMRSLPSKLLIDEQNLAIHEAICHSLNALQKEVWIAIGYIQMKDKKIPILITRNFESDEIGYAFIKKQSKRKIMLN